MFLSVTIPTYNPNVAMLGQVLDGLKKQNLHQSSWEVIIIDNNSSDDFTTSLDLSWHANIKLVKEPKQGLTYARRKGFIEASGDVVVMLDDDNIPATDYLRNVKQIFESNPQLGAIGGKSMPVFETKQPDWLIDFYGSLALRDLGNEVIIDKWSNCYPSAAPIGAGMAIRKSALQAYLLKLSNSKAAITDRAGTSLSSGGDNDIVLEILKSGWLTGYFPSLVISHIISEARMQPGYLARLVHDTNKSWVQLLESHAINPWKKINKASIGIRKLKAWFTHKAWRSKPAYIRWQGSCGIFEGLAQLRHYNGKQR